MENQPDHPLTNQESQQGIDAAREFISTYGPYITLAFIVFRFYTQMRLNKTLARIEKGLKLR
jgi:hypothetical protein